jgi:hypothetical protein
MSNLNFLPGLILYLSAIAPHAIHYKYNELMLGLKFFLFIIFLLIEKKKIIFKYFVIGIFVLILGLIGSFQSHDYEFSISRFMTYAVCIFLFSIKLKSLPNIFFFKRLYIISVLILTVVSLLRPEIVNFFYGWNDLNQQEQFLQSKKYVSIFGLPATASLCYGLIIFSIINSQKLFNKAISAILVLFFIFVLISLKSTSSFITIIFLLTYYLLIYFKRISLLTLIFIIILISLFLLISINLFFSDLLNLDYYLNFMKISFLNRFDEQYIFYGYRIDNLLIGFGFTSTIIISFGDIGYFDHLIRLGLIGAGLYYFLYYNFLKRLLFNQNYFILILYILILELGHSYSKSIVFLPVILIILFNLNNKATDN